jgi:hypothetical protein
VAPGLLHADGSLTPAPGVKRAYAIIMDRVEGASGGAAASAHLSTARHGEADGERSFRFGSRIRRLLAAYRHPTGHEAPIAPPALRCDDTALRLLVRNS